jgi:hypothetical protein
MIKSTFGTITAGRQRIREFIISAKNLDPNFRVIDIGGIAGGGWTSDIADVIVDINAPFTDSRFINADICNESHWNFILNKVDVEKFDYAICSHTLEDVYNPYTALALLPRIAKAGIISMPSAYTELSRIENTGWLGHIHHRYIFHPLNHKIHVIPKINALEFLVPNGLIFKKSFEEVRFEWFSDLEYSLFMNNYLGPSVEHVIHEYKNFIQELI